LKRLEENDLYVKPEKYMWKVRKIGFLEVVIGSNGIEMEKKKIDRVLSWPEPENIEDIRKFLGLTNYYRRFIKNFAQVARPMNDLYNQTSTSSSRLRQEVQSRSRYFKLCY